MSNARNNGQNSNQNSQLAANHRNNHTMSSLAEMQTPTINSGPGTSQPNQYQQPKIPAFTAAEHRTLELIHQTCKLLHQGLKTIYDRANNERLFTCFTSEYVDEISTKIYAAEARLEAIRDPPDQKNRRLYDQSRQWIETCRNLLTAASMNIGTFAGHSTTAPQTSTSERYAEGPFNNNSTNESSQQFATHQWAPFAPQNSTYEGPWNATNSTYNPVNYQIPKIQHFDGEQLSWQSFRDAITACILPVPVSEERKYFALLQLLPEKLRNSLQNQLISSQQPRFTLALHYLDQRFSVRAKVYRIALNDFLTYKPSAQKLSDRIEDVKDKIRILYTRILHEYNSDSERLHFLLYEMFRSYIPPECINDWDRHWTDSKKCPGSEDIIAFLDNQYNQRDLPSCRGYQIPNQPALNQQRPPRSTKPRCSFCFQSHFTSSCSIYDSSNLAGRKKMVTEANLCWNCLQSNHRKSDCKSTRNCQKCRERHHTSLCELPPVAANAARMPSFQHSGKPLLGTLYATAYNPITNKHVNVRCLCDGGSEQDFITPEIALELGLTAETVMRKVRGIGNTMAEPIRQMSIIRLKSRTENFSMDIEVGVMSNLIPESPSQNLRVDLPSTINTKQLADPNFGIPAPCEILLGVGTWEAIKNDIARIKIAGQYFAQSSRFGWVILGGNSPKNTSQITSLLTTTQVERFWEIEQETEQTADPDYCDKLFSETTCINSEGRIEVKIPFMPEFNKLLGNSRKIAIDRFLRLERRLQRDKKLLADYTDTINDYITNGEAIILPISTPDDQEYIMPHHPVYKQSSTTTKMRVVFDASCCTTSGYSLNQLMYSGPRILQDIRTIIFHWRIFRFAFSADITKMYRQFSIAPEQHRFQRIIWRINGKLVLIQLKRITFGVASAPYLAQKCIRYIGNNIQQKYPLASEQCQHDFYVDDLMSGGFDVQTCIKKQTELREAFSLFKLQLRKWCANEISVLENIPEDEIEMRTLAITNEPTVHKTLGIFWNEETDRFFFKSEIPKWRKFTKRTILSESARIYDPLGWLGPFIMTLKLINQRAWQIPNLNWDDPVPKEIAAEVTKCFQEVPTLQGVTIPRWIGINTSTEPLNLYIFSDASLKGYAAVVYHRSDKTEKFHLLASRSRVAPIRKEISLPRLELCGALLATELIKWIQNDIRHPIQNITAFSDSQITLWWIRGEAKKWESFVNNRVIKIRRIIPHSNWRYIRSNNNPADCISRGITANELIKQTIWWEGPNWEQLQADAHNFEVPNEPKTNNEVSVLHTKISNQWDFLQKYSDLTKYIRILSIIRSFINNMKCRQKRKLPSTDVLLIRSVQIETLESEKTAISKNIKLQNNNPLKTWRMFIDKNDVLRLVGRNIANKTLTYDEKHPMILPQHHQITRNIIYSAHKKTGHGNYQLMSSYIRRKFIFPRMKSSIKQHVHRCPKCIRFHKFNQEQLMGSLPSFRLTPTRPFTHTGIDYAGPVTIAAAEYRSPKTMKGYICIFICMVTKAVHIELARSLTTEEFLLCYDRFTNRRGRVECIYSDNGTNFVGAENKFTEFFQQTRQTAERDKRVKWHFIPPGAPQFGGIWEAAVKSVKTHLQRMTQNSKMSMTLLSTVLIGIEAILNSRPLARMSEDPEDLSYLTPGHFLIGEPIITPNLLWEPESSAIIPLSLKMLHVRQQFLTDFWRNWQRDYNNALHAIPKKLRNNRHLKEGDLVLITAENVKPLQWPMARVIQTIKGIDDIERVVIVKTANGILKRPINKCRLLLDLPIKNEN